MIKLTAKFIIKEGKAALVKDTASTLVAETRKEKGCISYQLFQDMDQPNVFAFIEEWESMEALQSHMKSKHFTEAIPKLNELKVKESEVNKYTVVL